MSEPLYPSVVNGIRCWRIVPDERGGDPLLGAAAVGSIWPPGVDLHATCSARGSHLAPSADCSCGVHAFHPWNGMALMRGFNENQRHVAGIVSAWGTLEVHLGGFRAEHARLEALFCDSPERRDVVAALAQRYGAEMIEVPSLTAARRHAMKLPGISRREAERLVLENFELILKPEGASFATSDGTQLARSGYYQEEQERLPGLFECPIAGVSFRPEALQSPAFAPGSEVTLVFEPHNEHDPHAIAVFDPETDTKVGYVPRRFNRRIGGALKRGISKRALILNQHRDMATGARVALELIVSPTERIELRDHPPEILELNEEEICF